MPIYTVQAPDGKTYDIEGPEGATPEQLGGVISANNAPKPYDASTFTKRAMSLGQGATFGFGDEIAGALGADKERYRATLEQHKQEEPIGSTVSNLIGGIASPVALMKAPQYLKKAAPVLELLNKSPALTAGGTGLVLGGIQAAGDAPEGQGVGGAALQGGGVGMGLGLGIMGATKAVSPVIGALGNGLIANTPKAGEKYSQWLARNRVADAFNRDNVSIRDVRDNIHRLGSEARFADAAGENTRGLLDLNANLPGKTKDDLEGLIRNRIATRPDRMDDAVYAVNGGYGKGKDVFEVLSAQQSGVAGPLYKQAHAADFAPNPALTRDLEAARTLGAWGEASKRSLANPSNGPFSLDPAQQYLGKGNVAVRDIDHIKQGIDTLIEKETDAVTGKVSGFGRDLVGLKNRILKETDSAVPVYAEARNAFAGPASLKTAITKGRSFWNENAESLETMMAGMNASEKEAFRIGASDKLRQMVGGQSGQNQLLNVWKDRNTREKLQALLGNDVKYSQVESMLKGEETLKRLEQLGPSRNSRTFSREAGSDQQNVDNASDLLQAGLNVKTGGLSALLSGASKVASRAATPEPVRNGIGSILMSKYSTDEMKALEMAMEAIKARQRSAAIATGSAGAQGNGLLDF